MPDEQQQRVLSENPDANGVIEALREAARTVKALGDQADAQAKHIDELQSAAEHLQSAAQRGEDAMLQLESWRDQLDRFRLDLIDKDELLRETIQARHAP